MQAIADSVSNLPIAAKAKSLANTIQLAEMTKRMTQFCLGAKPSQQHDSESSGGVALSTRAAAINIDTDLRSTTAPTDSESRNDMSKPRRSQHVTCEYKEQAAKLSEKCSKLETLLEARKEELELVTHRYGQSRRAEHKLQKEVDRLDEENKSLSDDIKEEQDDSAFLDRVWTDIIGKYLQPYAKRKGNAPAEFFEPEMHATLGKMFEEAVEVELLRDGMQKSQGDVRRLQDQLQALQSEMLTRVVRTQVTADDQFAQDFRNLAALVKTLSRTVRPDHEEDLIDTLGTPIILENVSQNHLSGRTGIKTHVQAWTWCVLMHFVFRSPFAIFGREGGNLATMYANMFHQGHYDGWPCPTTRSETWRYTTMEQLVESLGRDAMVRWESHTKDGTLSSSLIDLRAEVLGTIEQRFGDFSSSCDLERVRLIIDKAFALSMMMSRQAFRLQLTYPKVGDWFNADTMTALPNDDGEDVVEGVVAFVVHPGLTKWGDALGKNLDHRYDIVRSLVHLEVHPQTGDRGDQTKIRE